jgi:hypothetical protein
VERDGFTAVGVESPLVDYEIMYRIDIEGATPEHEDLGIARITPRFRDGTLEFGVWGEARFIANDHTLEEALETIRQDVMPGHHPDGLRR